MIHARSNGCCTIAIVLLLGSTALTDTVTIGPNGIDSAGLGTGAGVVIGQVERFRPGDAEAGDDLAHRNTTTNPAGVFEQNDPGVPPDSMTVMEHAQWVAGVMISTDATDPDSDGVAPTGVATGASLYSSGYLTDGTDPGYQHALLTLQFIATQPGMRAVNHSWGKQGPKRVVTRILENTDKRSVLQRLKEEIKKKISLNRYAGK